MARWIGGNSGYQSRTPDGRRWLDRADPRHTGATMAGSELWFSWSVDRGSNQRPRPFIQIARLDANNLTLLENINVFDTDSATCYGALSTNSDGEVGISYMIGGGTRFPTHVVGILTNDKKNVTTSAGTRSPLDNQWGDYLTVRRAFPNERLFAATGFTMIGRRQWLQSGRDPSIRDLRPRFGGGNRYHPSWRRNDNDSRRRDHYSGWRNHYDSGRWDSRRHSDDPHDLRRCFQGREHAAGGKCRGGAKDNGYCEAGGHGSARR